LILVATLPKSLFFIVGSEFCERFSFAGMSGIEHKGKKNIICKAMFKKL
jgi:hypothetical protein